MSTERCIHNSMLQLEYFATFASPQPTNKSTTPSIEKTTESRIRKDKTGNSYK